MSTRLDPDQVASKTKLMKADLSVAENIQRQGPGARVSYRTARHGVNALITSMGVPGKVGAASCPLQNLEAVGSNPRECTRVPVGSYYTKPFESRVARECELAFFFIDDGHKTDDKTAVLNPTAIQMKLRTGE